MGRVWPAAWHRFDEFAVFGRIARLDLHRLIPRICDGREFAIKVFTQSGDKLRQGIAEVLVFAAAETMPCHHDPAPKSFLIRIQAGECVTFLCGEDTGEYRVPVFIEPFRDTLPIKSFDACDRFRCRG